MAVKDGFCQFYCMAKNGFLLNCFRISFLEKVLIFLDSHWASTKSLFFGLKKTTFLAKIHFLSPYCRVRAGTCT